MHYQRLITKTLPLLLAALIACIIYAAIVAPWYEVVIGAMLGIIAGPLIGYRGIRLMRAHILHNNRARFGPRHKPIGILVFFVIPAIAGMVLGSLVRHQVPFVFAGIVFGATLLAGWWSVMAWWIAHIEQRSGRAILLLHDGFYLAR